VRKQPAAKELSILAHGNLRAWPEKPTSETFMHSDSSRYVFCIARPAQIRLEEATALVYNPGMLSIDSRLLLHFLSSLMVLLVLQACTSIPVAQRADKRAQLDKEAQETLAQMIKHDPDIEQELDEAAGYFVSRVSAANLAVIGGGQGIGVLVDFGSGDRTYLNVKRFDFGAGLGVRYFRVLLIINEQETLRDIRDGWTFRGVASNLAVGNKGNENTSQTSEGLSVHILSETGASIAATARAVRLSVNQDLTDTGLSEISIPNIGFGIEDGLAEPEKRWWDHKMPFMAQAVIDKGYDLPLPYGLKLIYVNVDQAQLLDNLYVGFNGSEQVLLDDWVAFENARSKSDTVQATFDTWVFPFMNVFAILGKIDGHAPMDVIVEGNGFLDQLGIDCSKPGNVVACNLLQDKEFTLPIDASFKGNNYGIGINLAGGWKGYFVTIPITYVYADLEGKDTDGFVISASPRVGKVFELKNKGNLALYVGGSYLDSELTVDGSLIVPGTDISLEYTIDQDNKDKWTAIVGANWDINRNWSLQGEYNGFVGSRETWMGSITWRF
jgi:lipid-binding SYLF domain-containing protein